MRRNAQSANLVSALIIAVVVVACSISGLAAGVYARHLGDSLAAASTAATAPVSSHTPHVTATATVAAVTTATTPPYSAGNVAFALSVSVSPNALPAGQSFTVTVTAVTRDGSQAPIAGLTCYMRAPSDGRAPLLQTWPPPQITGANGQATWNLTAPQVAPGTYGVEVVAYGTNSYSYHYDSHVTITG